jgi:hypothetical protein
VATNEKTGPLIAGCVTLIVTAPIAALFNGWVLTKLWAWFVVAHFDAKPLPVGVAMGVSLIVGMLTHQRQPKRDRGDDEESSDIVIGALVEMFGTPAIALLVGLAIRGWVL